MIKLKEILDNNRKIKLIVVVTGIYQAGKSSFVHSVSGGGLIEVDESDYYDMPIEQLLAMEMPYTSMLGVLPLGENAEIVFWESRGSRRFDMVLDEHKNLPYVFFVLFNRARPDTFREVKSIAETLKPHAVPALFLGNFGHEPDAWDMADLKIALRTNDILACNAREQKDCIEALRQLLKASDKADIRDLAKFLP